ncbi:MAG: hypothetical protein ACOYMA_13705 [Bacteroidia bacterium]
MLTIYNTFHLVTSNDGILLVSTKNTDYPFVIMKNNKMGLVVMHYNEVNYDLRMRVKKIEELDLSNMVLYHVCIGEPSFWAVTIPYFSKVVDPNSLYAFTDISIHKSFENKDFPLKMDEYSSLAVVTGFPE